MKKKVLEIFAWIIFIIVMAILTIIFFKYIDPIINPEKTKLQLNDVMIVIEKENGETVTYQAKDDDKFYLEIEETEETKE